jgi:hypothetical protein
MVFCFECKNISYLMSFFFVQMESLALNWNTTKKTELKC